MNKAIMEDKKIMLIDDDKRLHEGIQDFLGPNGFKIHSLFSGHGASEELIKIHPDILLLDVMLPGGGDGFSVLREIRKISEIPVIMLTARGEETDRIVGLELGADDYLPKPFSLRELLARIKAVLRRSTPHEATPVSYAPEDKDGKIQVGPFTLDHKRHCLHWHDKSVALSTSEVIMLQAFMEHKGEVLSRDQILSLAFGDAYCAGDRNIDVHVSRLRSLLRGLDQSLCPIRTIWGKGYRWAEDA